MTNFSIETTLLKRLEHYLEKMFEILLLYLPKSAELKIKKNVQNKMLDKFNYGINLYDIFSLYTISWTFWYKHAITHNIICINFHVF